MRNTITRFLLASSLFTGCTLEDVEDGSIDDLEVDETDQELSTNSIWGRLAAVGDSKCLDVKDLRTDPGTIQLYTCGDATQRTFQVETRQNASPIKAHLDQSKVIQVSSGKLKLGTSLIDNTKLFNFVDNEIKAVGNCLAIQNTSSSFVWMRRCQDTIHRWTYDQELHQIKGSDGRCLTWSAPILHSSIGVETCNPSLATQRWTHRGDGHFVAGTTNLCLNVTGANTADGAPLQLYTCSDGDRASRFYITGQLRQNGQCLGLPPNNTNPSLPDVNNGVQPLIEPCDAAAIDQRWTLSWSSRGNP